MDQQHDSDILSVCLRVLWLVVGWLASWKIGEIQALAGTLSAVLVGVAAGMNAWVVWRDKVRPRRRRGPAP